MTIDNAILKFTILWDNFTRAAKTDYEISCLLNQAQFYLLKERVAPLRHSPANSNQPHFDSFHNLIESYKGRIITTDQDGCLAHEVLQNDFPQDKVYDDCGNLIDSKKPDVLHIQYIKRQGERGMRKTKWVSHNEYPMWCDNCFLEPTDEHPIWLSYENYIAMKPGGARNLELAVIRNPVHMWKVEGRIVHPELNDHLMYQVIMKALELAGIESRDSQLFQMAQNEEARI
jgi:hypothetical protein